MDVRDFYFWFREAARAELSERISRLSVVRTAAWASDKDFRKVLLDLDSELVDLDGRRREVVDENWARLREMSGKGGGDVV